ncbi:hypothetical protein CCHL11_02351 [Colletotrichum chlorophyti]|uniref:Cyclochlorotine biosynthesis protein R n=1 Tax=Colletotrichum chlorophyti TaxID=708187 RepID=A0A1Q8S629_9PEZI|nr:hypothetical protein CCHL11_02351 [Colletotrichum chlorophyti]
MGKNVKFANKPDPMGKYDALEEIDEGHEDEIESVGSVELNRRNRDDHSFTFPDQWNQDRVAWDQRLQKARRVAWIQSVLLVILVGYIIFLQFKIQWPSVVDVPLGVDPSGFVPPEIGQPVKWSKYDDDSDPHHFNSDAFDSLEKVRAAAREFKMMHNGGSNEPGSLSIIASNVRINGKYTTYMDFNDEKQPLPPYVTRKGSELYSIRAFHQMHCVSIVFEDIGYRVHNKTSKWSYDHVIHCLNTLRASVQCLADATPLSYLHGLGVGHTTDGQQIRCRDFFALREWAHDPVRRVRWKNTAPEDQKDQYEELPEQTTLSKDEETLQR